jgi:flagellar protein FliT
MCPPDDGRRLSAAARTGGLRKTALNLYESIAAESRLMLEAARADDWPRVAAHEDRCKSLIRLLRTALRATPMVEHERKQRIELLRSILANDAQMRARSEPWVRQIETLLARRTPTAPDDST